MDPSADAILPLPATSTEDAATPPPAGVVCCSCQHLLLVQYFDVGGEPMCEACQRRAVERAATPRSWGVFARALLFGIVASIAGAVLYYGVIAITELEIGIVAVAIGYMVGWAIRRGAGGRGGRRFQVMGLVLTYWAVGLSYVPVGLFSDADSTTVHATAEAPRSDPGAARPGTEGPAASSMAALASPGAGGAAPSESGGRTTASPEAAASPDPEAASSSGAAGANMARGLAFLLAFSFTLPVLVVTGTMPGGLISGVIIAVGMHQAWKMTAATVVDVSGPFRIATPPPEGTSPAEGMETP